MLRAGSWDTFNH